MADRDWVGFLQWALPQMHLRWKGFRQVRGQVIKRIRSRIEALGLPDLEAYRRRLEHRPDEWERLDGLCRITISRFYRDRRVFDALRDRVLPELARGVTCRGDSPAAVTSWSVGCASGEEPYTLSIVWTLAVESSCPGVELRILATDADAHMLQRAGRGVYEPSSLQDLPLGWLDRSFAHDEGGHCIRSELRGRIEFRELDVRRSLPGDRFDLILCRNLAFTYFDESLQRKTLERLAGRLHDGGVLVIGVHERLPADNRWVEPIDRILPIYRRRRDPGGDASSMARDVP